MWLVASERDPESQQRTGAMSHRYDDGYDDDSAGEGWSRSDTAVVLVAAAIFGVGLLALVMGVKA